MWRPLRVVSHINGRALVEFVGAERLAAAGLAAANGSSASTCATSQFSWRPRDSGRELNWLNALDLLKLVNRLNLLKLVNLRRRLKLVKRPMLLSLVRLPGLFILVILLRLCDWADRASLRELLNAPSSFKVFDLISLVRLLD